MNDFPDDFKTQMANLPTRIRIIWNAAKGYAARSVNSAHVCAFWLVGREILLEEQNGRERAAYGARLIPTLAEQLKKDGETNWSKRNLDYARSFYLDYPTLIDAEIVNSVRSQFGISHADQKNMNAPRSLSIGPSNHSENDLAFHAIIRQAITSEEWTPGRFTPKLSWTHYRALLRVKRREARDFYEIEAVRNAWSARELDRQIASLLFERLLKSRDKEGLMALANEGLCLERPVDIIRDPYVLEFLNLPSDHRLVETQVEAALISKMRAFLLELGTGFAFVGRQKRITLDGDHFYPDLIFYHVVLKCYVIIDIKVRKLDHSDLGQMQLYVNFYDREVCADDDRPTIGIILCTDKNDAVVRYILPEKDPQIFASRFQLHFPSEEQLRRELQREFDLLTPPTEESR